MQQRKKQLLFKSEIFPKDYYLKSVQMTNKFRVCSFAFQRRDIYSNLIDTHTRFVEERFRNRLLLKSL